MKSNTGYLSWQEEMNAREDKEFADIIDMIEIIDLLTEVNKIATLLNIDIETDNLNKQQLMAFIEKYKERYRKLEKFK